MHRLALLLLALLTLTGCSNTITGIEEDVTEDVGKDLVTFGEGAEETNETLEKGAEEIGPGVERAAEDVGHTGQEMEAKAERMKETEQGKAKEEAQKP